jgi:hypothetical protein
MDRVVTRIPMIGLARLFDLGEFLHGADFFMAGTWVRGGPSQGLAETGGDAGDDPVDIRFGHADMQR